MADNRDESIKKLEAEILLLKKQLNQSQAEFLNIVGRSKDGILVCNELGIIVYVNPAAQALFGKNLGDLLGENIGIFIDPNTATEITLVNKERGPIIAEVSIAHTTWNNKPAKLASLHDVTEHKKMESLLKNLSYYDHLTQLPNRIYFRQELKKSLARSSRINKKMALMYLDIDNFKEINDNYGHDIGDKLLIQFADRLKACIRINDLPSRLGGDEFAVILDSINDSTNAADAAKKIIAAVKKIIYVNQYQLKVSCSIGIAIYPDNGKTEEVLLKMADQAMYKSKKNGRDQFSFF